MRKKSLLFTMAAGLFLGIMFGASFKSFSAELISDPTIDTYFAGDMVDYGDNVKFLSSTEGFLKNKFISYKDNYYYFDEDGFQKPKVISINGELTIINGSENIINGWINVDNTWRYLRDEEILTGWQQVEAEDGTIYWRYFDEQGSMLENTYTPDGYFVNEDGVWVEEKPYTEASADLSNTYVDNNGISGYKIDNTPAELFMLCIAGETSGLLNPNALVNGDQGQAYGVIQFDYRYDLVDFMNQAYTSDRDLWHGFVSLKNQPRGSSKLVSNSIIGGTFVSAMNRAPKTAMAEQINFAKKEYWNSCKARMDAAGYNLDGRNIAVSAAMFSINVNCGNSTNYYLQYLNPSMNDEEMIDALYNIRNNILSNTNVGNRKKGTNGRFLVSEPQMAKDILYGRINILSEAGYGNGVEWHGQTFAKYLTN
ncbi:MAG: hypothetical protein Q4P22_06600 [Eubacteriales bacterium]|nr:hypothetical protein [Eubacteriales bacterium]